jgi:hypothetical protein
VENAVEKIKESLDKLYMAIEKYGIKMSDIQIRTMKARSLCVRDKMVLF